MKFFRTLLASAVLTLALSAHSAQAATFQITYGAGFNDNTAAAPVGGNPGTTVGAQRKNAFIRATQLWGARLVSSVPIRVNASFDPLSCSANSGVLGSAGAATYGRDWMNPAPPRAGTWYPIALANALAGRDLSGVDDIEAQFNSETGKPGCLQSSGWYYGYDGNVPAGKIDFLAVLLHELGHGLGFAALYDEQSGAKAGDDLNGRFDDIFMVNLERHGQGPLWKMNNAGRAAASKADGLLHWIGPNVLARIGTLTGGTNNSHVQMYAPPSLELGSSVSHWDTDLAPNQLMEPDYTGPIHTFELELAAFKDIGWTVSNGKSNTTTTLTSNHPTIVYGQGVTFTATVTGGSAPTGTVTFKRNGTAIGNGTVASGKATLATTSLPAGMFNITATYNGDSTHNASTSAAVVQTVQKETTTTALTATPSDQFKGKPIQFVATVTGNTVAPTGSVQFKEGSTVKGTVALNANKATLNLTLGMGSHTITAGYPGNTNVNTSQASTTVLVSGGALNGAETRVNTAVSGNQQNPSIAKLNGGPYVVVWQSSGQDGSGFGIYGQRYNATGAKLGAEFNVSTPPSANDQTTPRVAALTDGGFVVVFTSNSGGTAVQDVFARRYTAAGAPTSAPFRVNKTVAGAQLSPAVTGLDNGRFAVVWQGVDAGGSGIYSQVFNANSTPVLNSDVLVNTTTAGEQTVPAVAKMLAGGFVVTWQSDGQDGSGNGIYMQMMSVANVKVGVETAVNTTTMNHQITPAIASLADNGFVIVWTSSLQDGSGLSVYGQRYDQAGATAGSEFPVNTVTANNQYEPSVSGFGTGGFLVSWTSQQDGSGTGIYGQAFKATGAKADVEFKFNTTVVNAQNRSAVAAFNSGVAVGVWNSTNQDGSGMGVYLQKVTVPGTP